MSKPPGLFQESPSIFLPKKQKGHLWRERERESESHAKCRRILRPPFVTGLHVGVIRHELNQQGRSSGQEATVQHLAPRERGVQASLSEWQNNPKHGERILPGGPLRAQQASLSAFTPIPARVRSLSASGRLCHQKRGKSNWPSSASESSQNPKKGSERIPLYGCGSKMG